MDDSLFPIIATITLLSIPLLGLVGVFLNRHLGAKRYREILPRAQEQIYKALGPRGSVFASALDPNEWKTDKRSVLLIIFGLPFGLVIVYGIALMITLLLGL
jgi:hypothetical protein